MTSKIFGYGTGQLHGVAKNQVAARWVCNFNAFKLDESEGASVYGGTQCTGHRIIASSRKIKGRMILVSEFSE